MSCDPHIQKLINDHLTGKGSTIKLLGETIGDYLHDFGIGKQFLKQNVKNTMKENNDKLDFIKLYAYVYQSHHQERENASHRLGNNVCSMYI